MSETQTPYAEPEQSSVEKHASPVEEAQRVIAEDLVRRQNEAAELFLEFQKKVAALGLRLSVACTAVMDERAQFVMTFKPLSEPRQ